MGYPRELERALNEAIESGVPVTEEQLYELLGLDPPPVGALL